MASAGGGATTGGRVGNVDVLRAVAALMVVAGHAYGLGGRTVSVQAERWYDVLVINGAAGVWLFFAISGYVIGKPFIDRLVTGRPLPSLAPYALRRAARIFPLYWIALTAFIVIAGAGATTGWQFPLHYLLLHNLVPGREGAILSVAWTLSVEMLFYIAVPLLALAVARRRQVSAEWLAGAVVASWVASIALTTVADLLIDGTTGIWARTLFPMTWQMFCPGLLVALAPHLTSARWRAVLIDFPRRPAALAAIVVLLVGAAVAYPYMPLGHGVPLWSLGVDLLRPAWAIGFGLLLALAVQAPPLRSRILLRLGTVSYGIYLYHAIVLAFMYEHWIPLPEQGIGAYLVHFIVLAGIAILIALASWRFLEEPLIRRARAVGRRERSRVAA